MALRLLLLFLIPLVTVYAASVPNDTSIDDKQELNDTQTGESGIIETFASLQLPQLLSASQSNLPDLTSFPYEEYHDVASSYGPPPEPQPSFGVSVNTQAVLAPQLEIIRFLEAFLNLKSEILARVQSLLNENWDLGRALINVIIGKLQQLQAFLLKGVSLLRSVLEFVLNLFSNWSLTLPSLTLGATTPLHPQPHLTYGIPPGAAVTTTNFSG
ncbi:hypothetical protein RN001_000257 [Aquatica leii]|uniref:Uncharacterized protein n=1 Tax=Aquatica leii TaxID=1421715 RepID=A0AAN7PM22_9COLE|nr:hypothetical protein RN001_000257 [Aquatica leii]